MPFEGLSEKLQKSIKMLQGKGRLTEKDIKEAMREVKLALLEADVNFKVVKKFVNDVSEKAIGSGILESLSPSNMVIKIVNEELTNLLGGSVSRINMNPNGKTIIMLSGLQGAGKTTFAGKLALKIRKEGKKPLLVATDIYRPAAIKQLQTIGSQIDVPVFSLGDKVAPKEIVRNALIEADKNGNNVVIIDTAGRLHIDEELMQELKGIKEEFNPHEILLVLDSMTGQDAVTVAQTFNEELKVDGVILTKLDGDTRGGAALSLREVANLPIKFVGVGEKMNDLDTFHPDRMASRILGMGDVLSLIEKAQENFDEAETSAMAEKIMNKEMDLDMYLTMMNQTKKMGPLDKIVGMLPGVDKNMISDDQMSKGKEEMNKMEAIIKSMTMKERKNPSLFTNNSSRKKRVAAGSGTTISDVNRVLKNFEMMKKTMRQFMGPAGMGNIKKMGKKFPFGKGKMPF